jgi:L-asparaginase
MKKLLLTLTTLFFVLNSESYAKNIVVIATGGTISGAGESQTDSKYSASKVDINEIVNSIPNISAIANVSAEQLIQINSQDIDENVWIKIAQRVEEVAKRSDVDGIVITHGTDTMEETAYFLNLALKTKKPVVLTGSMRPSTSVSADGYLNLLNAIALASSDNAYDLGVLIFMNDEVFAARDVTKTHTTNVASFKSNNGGPLGFVHYGKVKIYYHSAQKHTTETPFKVKNLTNLPKAEIVYIHAGNDASIVDHLVAKGTKIIILAGVGDGNVSQKTLAKLVEARKQGVIIVRSFRGGFGFVVPNAEINDEEFGFVTANNLNPQKARILAMLALTKTSDVKEIQQIFDKF